jgi:hypothetical protein
MTTFSAFISALRLELWPDGEAKTLRNVHTSQFKAAMANIQTYVEPLQAINVSTYARCERLWEDAKTVLGSPPNGIIRRVFTIVNDDWRDKVIYHSSNFHTMERWAKTLREAVTPDNGTIGYGYRYEDADSDSEIGRARVGIWCLHRGKMFVAPWLQSNEVLVIEWDGVKTDYEDADQIDESKWSIDVQEAIKYYVLFQHEMHFGDRIQARDWKALYDAKLSDLMILFRDRTKQQPVQEIPEAVDYLTTEEIENDDEAADGVETPCEAGDLEVPDTEASDSSRPRHMSGEEDPTEGGVAAAEGSTYLKTSEPKGLYGKFSGDATEDGWELISGE